MPRVEPPIPVRNSLIGTTGARSGANAIDAVDNTVTNAKNHPAEMLEQAYLPIAERQELRLGSGDAGQFYGGQGMLCALR